MRELIQPAVVLFLALTLITGVAYPIIVTGMAQAAFPEQANGSLITSEGMLTFDATAAAGSGLVGQPFDRPEYFWSRLSATRPVPYNAAASSGSNLGPLNPALVESAAGRVQQLLAADPAAQLPVPVDLVTASGSGLDPNISPAAALYQAPRVAVARGLEPAKVTELVRQHTTGRSFGLLGEPRVNVLRLNLALDKLTQPVSNTEE